MKVEKKEWFESWFGSPYYGVLYEHRSDAEARFFVQRLSEVLHFEKGQKALDVGCGDGRYAMELTHQDLCVTGIDISFEQIEKAKKLESDCSEFFLHDMRESFRYNYYDFVFNFFTSFGYFSSKRDTLAAANTLATALKPGGQLVIDYLNVAHSLQKLKSHEQIERGGIGFEIKRKVENGTFYKKILVTDANAQHQYQEQVAAFQLADFLSFFEPLGLTLSATYGSYGLDEYVAEHSPRLIMVFDKK